MNLGFSPKILPQAESIIIFDKSKYWAVGVVVIAKDPCVDWADVHTGRSGHSINTRNQSQLQTSVDPMAAKGAFLYYTTSPPVHFS